MRLWLLILLAVVASACATPTYIARVDRDEITPRDVKDEFRRRHGGHQSFLGAEPEVRSFVEKVIDHKLLVQEAYRLGLDDDEDIRKAAKAFELKKVLEHLKKVEIEDKAKPSEAEIHEIFDYKLDQTYIVKQLVVPTRQEANDIRAQLASGADFEAIARERSIAHSKMYGGNLPPIGWGAMDPAWEAVVFSLKDGELSPVMEVKDGYEVVRLVSRNDVQKPEFARAGVTIRNVLERRKRDALKKELAASLWTKYHVKLEPFDRDAAALKAARESLSPLEARAATWDRGQLLVREFAKALDLDLLSSLPAEGAERQLREALDNIIDPELLMLEAEARDYGKLPDIAEDVTAYRDDLVLGRFYGEFLLKGMAVTDDEVKQYYEAHKAELATPEERHVSHIVVEKEETAAEVQKKLADGARFEDLVKPYSKDPETVKRAGDLGWVTKRQAVGDFAIIFDLDEGMTSSKPVKSQFGYHIFKVTGTKPPRPLTLDETKDDLREKLLREKRETKRATWVKKLRESTVVVVNPAGIRKFIADNPLGQQVGAPPPHNPAMEQASAAGAGQHGAAGHGAGDGANAFAPLAPAPAASQRQPSPPPAPSQSPAPAAQPAGAAAPTDATPSAGFIAPAPAAK